MHFPCLIPDLFSRVGGKCTTLQLVKSLGYSFFLLATRYEYIYINIANLKENTSISIFIMFNILFFHPSNWSYSFFKIRTQMRSIYKIRNKMSREYYAWIHQLLSSRLFLMFVFQNVSSFLLLELSQCFYNIDRPRAPLAKA